jgi:acetylornithine/succinyldiaminopimelate/putrescine aminotransferase
VEAVQSQVAKYMHTMVYGEFVMAPQVLLAKALSEALPPPLDSVYLVNSGAEAVEGALKLAKKVTGRYEIVAGCNAYHGSTHGAMSLMSNEVYTRPFRPLLPQIRFIDFNDESQIDQISEDTAAVILETIQAESGILQPKKDYLIKVARRTREVGALLILDEIQCAFGRTGSLFAFSQYGITPDILILAKGMGGGMPIGAFVASPAHMHQLAINPSLGHITTFGGHPVNCAAALATLQVLQTQDLVGQVPDKEKLFGKLLPHPLIKEIRQSGLWFALDLGDANLLQKVVSRAVEKGVLIDWFLFNDHSIRIAPPLIIEAADIRKACAILHAVFDEMM